MHFVSQVSFVVWGLLMVGYVAGRMSKAQSFSIVCGREYRLVSIAVLLLWIVTGTLSGLFGL